MCVWGAWGATTRPDAGGAQRQRPVCQPPVQPQPRPSERLLPAPHQQHQLLRPLPTSETAVHPSYPSHRRNSQLFEFRGSNLLFISVHIEHFQNQIYTPPKDQSTCCGVCKNISCLYEHENGTTLLYKVHLVFQNLSTCA